MSELVLYAKVTDKWFVNQYDKLVSILNQQDKQRFDKMRSLLKRQQLVLSRFLLQQAIIEHNRKDKESKRHFKKICKVDSYHMENYNKVIVNQQYSFSISITHSAQLAAVCVSENDIKIGIDLEQVKQRKFNELSKEICTPNELTRIKKLKYEPLSFYLLWTAKEALTKAASVNLFDSFSFDCSEVLTSNRGIINTPKTSFSFQAIKLKHESQSFIGTVVYERSHDNQFNNNTLMSRDVGDLWRYYQS